MAQGKRDRFARLGLKPPVSAETFAEHLKQRQQAAKGLEKDLLSEVPMLYGSPGGMEPNGDPGITLAQAHRDEMLRRNGGGVLNTPDTRSDDPLPFERGIEALVVVILLLLIFSSR